MGQNCIEFNNSVMDYLSKTDSIEVVVLSSSFEYFVAKGKKLLKTDTVTGISKIVEPGQETALKALKESVDRLHSMGKKVVVIAPPPVSGFDIQRCLERKESDLLSFGISDNCKVNVSVWLKRKVEVNNLMSAIASQAGVKVIHRSDYLCNSNDCRTSIDGKFIFRDAGHLSHEGSVLVANAIDLVKKIDQLAK